MNFRRKIAIDLGTASVLVYLPNKGVVLNEPSVVAMNSFNSKIISVGKDAKKILGRTPGNIIAKKPLKDGVVADFNSTEKIISYLLKKTLGKSLIRPEVLI
ncbi:MAG: rod shape-determining protein, partial [Finegoldia magna]|nr:rod shape-determining protein [Finegoldia magna]